MARITIDVPDDLLEQLAEMGGSVEETLRDRLPQLLQAQPPILPTHVYRYVLDFLASQPTPAQIAAFRPTAEMQERLQTLLAQSQRGVIAPEALQELDEYERLEHLVILLKLGNLPYLTSQPK